MDYSQRHKFWKELEALGEDEVRARLVTQIYGTSGVKHALVVEWVDLQERLRNESSSLQSRKTARSAKNAAIVAATAAIISVIVSAISLYLSVKP